ncbi:hypothetical protein BKA70DRAFT_1219358 [Coprinopsis sp. MPI-PUGE-AT-0042]|nr:hypothetical protein BKA70DRAFT_1219358 [Coprinopsis sp. MPI-PUGE-AT-0042]
MKATTFFSKAAALLSLSIVEQHHRKHVAPTPLICTFMSLPTEVLLAIAEYLDSVKALRATCLSLNALFEDRTLHTVVINVHHENLDASIAQLQALARGWQHSKLAKRLRIIGLKPSYITSPGGPGSPLKRRASAEKHVSKSTVDLVRLLPLALATFKHLTSVDLILHHQDVPGAWQTVMDWLPNLPQLRDLTFNASEASSAALRQLSFGGLPQLTSAHLNLKWPYATSQATGSKNLNLNLSRFVLQSPNLSQLSVNIHHSSANSFVLLEKVFLSALEEPASKPTNLTCMRLEGQITVNPASILPFRGLRSLHLRNWPSRYLEYRNELESELSSSTLWNALRKNRVFLEDISAALVPEFVDYLGSYRSLKTLQLSVEMNVKDLLYTPAGIYEYLASHCDTLTSLEVKFQGALDPPQWWFDHHQAPSLSRLCNLQHLCLPIPSDSVLLKSTLPHHYRNSLAARSAQPYCVFPYAVESS